MRSLSVILVIALVLTLTLAFAPCARAEETAIDWENYDWAHLDLTMDTQTWESALAWLRAEADPSLLLLIGSQTDGMFSTDIVCILSDRFISEPEEVLYALVNEYETSSRSYHHSIISEADDWDKMIKALESVSLSGPDAEKGYKILSEMIAYAEETYRTEITNPKTGDPVGVAVALLALSGIGGGLMIWRKKSSRYAA